MTFILFRFIQFGSTSIAPHKTKEETYISIFPNPNNGKMYLKADFNKNDFIEINAMNILGDCIKIKYNYVCLLYTSPSPRDRQKSRMPSSA